MMDGISTFLSPTTDDPSKPVGRAPPKQRACSQQVSSQTYFPFPHWMAASPPRHVMLQVADLPQERAQLPPAHVALQ